MTNTVLSSTFLLTQLLMVGLFFFIRAATKDRTETLQVTVAKTPETLQS
ncbi:MAG: cofactor assembly of complex C subunit B, partial [Cyanobacteria bacterium Co-bin8]|nr:cofactor assembly of complex C subunit B [Cyanobacteria bacterium Co-bin8]